MQLISDIINHLVSQDVSLTVPLTKTKVLATRIENPQLLEWVNNELKGYSDKISLPEYRKTQGSVLADFINNNYKITNYPIQLPDVGEELEREMKEFLLFESISTMEANWKNENDVMILRYPDGVKASLEKIMRNSNGPYFQLLNVGISVPLQFILQVLAAVKDRLLDFMLEIERQFGMETELATLKMNNTKVDNIYHTTIHNNGHGNIVNTGNNSIIKVGEGSTIRNKEKLSDILSFNRVPQEDLADLLKIIDTGAINASGYGIAVNSWIKRMIGRALDGTWNVEIGKAGKILDDTLKAYYN